MSDGARSVRVLIREAFSLLLELRSRREARKLLAQAVTFLRMLEHKGTSGDFPVVVSIQLMHLKEP